MNTILSCFILSYILIYFCRLLYTLILSLIYTLIYYTLLYTAPHILHHSYILSYTLIHSLIYSFIYSLLSYSLIALLILPRRFIPLISLLYTCHFYFHIPLPPIFLYSHIVIPTLLYRRGITTLPPIFTRFTSLS